MEWRLHSKPILVNMSKTLGVMILTTLLSSFFRSIGFHESNIIMAFILGVLFVAKVTDGFLYGIAASVLGVASFNFFFTEPYYSLKTDNPDYPVTFAVMLAATVITGTLTTRIKEEARATSIREERAQALYHISKKLLRARSMKEIAEAGGQETSLLVDRPVILITAAAPDKPAERFLFPAGSDEETERLSRLANTALIQESVRTGKMVGAGTTACGDHPVHYLPIKGQDSVLGVMGVACFGNRLLKVLTHKCLLQEIWGSASGDDTQSLRVFMANIRRKIEKDPAEPRYILTEIGVGYRLAEE